MADFPASRFESAKGFLVAVLENAESTGQTRPRRLSDKAVGRSVLVMVVAVSCMSGCGTGHKAAKSVTTPTLRTTPTGSLGAVQGSRVPPLNVDGKATTKAGVETPGSPWPSLSTAGFRRGKPLRKRGPITVRTNGAVIDGAEVQTEINIEANNVTIRNSHVIGNGEWSILQRKGFSGLRIENTEINGDGVHKAQFGILNFGGMLTVRRVYIHTVSDGIGTNQGLIEDSLIMDLKKFPKDHVDGIQSNDGPAPGTSLVIRHNVILNPISQTSAIALFQDFGRAHDVTVDNNFLAGGGYALYGGKGNHGRSSNIRITRNAFSRKYFKNAGAFGPVTAFDQGSGNVWSGNVWAETGKPVQP
jgi:hypothetical protein